MSFLSLCGSSQIFTFGYILLIYAAYMGSYSEQDSEVLSTSLLPCVCYSFLHLSIYYHLSTYYYYQGILRDTSVGHTHVVCVGTLPSVHYGVQLYSL